MLAGALQERLIWVVPLAVAVRPVGAPGTVVAVVALSTLEAVPIVHDSQHNHSSSAFSPGGRHPLKDRLDGVRLAMGCDSASLPPHVGFVFEWIQEIDPELVKIAHVAGYDRQPMHQGRRGDHGILQQGV